MTYAWRKDFPGEEVFSVSWIIDAPWAHPVWSQYELALYDLTSPHPGGEPVRHLPDATHEFLLHALDPAKRIERDADLTAEMMHRLTPPNYGYQFRADSNEAAQERLQAVVDGIVAGKISPDTDFRQLWDEQLFPDAYPLVRSALFEEED